jgi:diguanylate cyclase (GGDEF)-like protein
MRYTPSLRTKFTIVLLITSLLSLLAAGLIARAILFRAFNRVVMQESFRRYHSEMTMYFKTYGSWQNARRREPFGEFEKRRRHLYNGPPADGPPRIGSGSMSGNATSTPTLDAAVQQEKSRPPFRFALADSQGRILMGGGHYKIGSLAPAALRATGQPVLLNGKIVAIALPDPRPNLNHLDLGYLQAVQQALLAAGLTTSLLALVLGLLVGERFSGRIHRLTKAIGAMQPGELRQCVEEYSRDEIGVLARAFNRMSEELAEAHEALEKSNQQISRQAAQLQELSIRDALTGLYNRRHFDEQGAHLLAEAKRYDRPLSVMIGDIDFFKKINDNFSHATGDEVLRCVSKLLQENTRESDVLARYGGEEFVIVFPQTPLPAANALCEKLRALIEEYSWCEVHPELRVTMSIGVAGDLSCDSFEKLLAAADEQLYRAKDDGRNRVCCDLQSDALPYEYLPLQATLSAETMSAA